MKLNKKIVSLGMIFAFTLSPLSQLVLARGIDNPNEVSPDVWAGRPGGNGDGSEEYLNLGYGEMNGPYKAVGSETGKVSDFNRARNMVEVIAFGIVIPGAANKFISISLDLATTVLSDSSDIEGIVYKATMFVSGRRSKLAIQTYRDDEMTEPYKYYEEITKW